MTKLYVGNLPYSVNDDALRDMFVSFGNVVSASVIMDRNSGRSKGFGFVEFDSEEAAKAAIAEVNGKDMDGRKLVVSEARPMERSNDRGGFGDRRSFNRDNRNRY